MAEAAYLDSSFVGVLQIYCKKLAAHFYPGSLFCAVNAMYCAFIQVENTIRWRYARDEHGNVKYDELGNQQKESNAQVVRWSDGRCLPFIIHFTLH